MWTRIKKEPALIAALLSVLGAVLGYFIKNPEVIAALVGVAAVFLGIRQVVVPVTTMVENVTESATIAATETVKHLSQDTVGTVGHVTKAGKEVITETVATVVGGLFGKGKQ